MKPGGPLYAAALKSHVFCDPVAEAHPARPKQQWVPFFSSTDGHSIDTSMCGLGPGYWQRSAEQPVLFRSAFRKLMTKDGLDSVEPSTSGQEHHVFVEIGPHPALQSSVSQILQEHDIDETVASWSYVSTLHRNQDADVALLTAAGRLHSLHIQLDLRAIIPTSNKKLVTILPPYSWDRSDPATHLDVPVNAARYKHRRWPRHELLGSRVLEGNDLQPAWRVVLDMNEASWLPEHVTCRFLVFPVVGYIAMAGAAVLQIASRTAAGQERQKHQHHYTVRNLHAVKPLVLDLNTRHELQTQLRATIGPPGWYDFQIMSCKADGTGWMRYCTGEVRSGSDVGGVVEQELGNVASLCSGDLSSRVPAQSLYDMAKSAGSDWRTVFQRLGDIRISTTEKAAWATVHDWEGTEQNAAMYYRHPVLLEQCFQMAFAARYQAQNPEHPANTCLFPTHITEVVVFKSSQTEQIQSPDIRICACARSILPEDTNHSQTLDFEADARMLDADLQPVVILRGATFARLPLGDENTDRSGSDAMRESTGQDHHNNGDYFVALARNDPDKLQQPAVIAELATLIARYLFTIVSLPNGESFETVLHQSLNVLGLDSLVTQETITWIRRTFHIRISDQHVRQSSSLLQLGQQVVQLLAADTVM